MSLAYVQTIQQQIMQDNHGLLSIVFKDLDEQLKNPESTEYKTLTTFIGMVASIQLAEKTANETRAFLNSLDLDAENYQLQKIQSKTAMFDCDEPDNNPQNVENTTHLYSLLPDISAKLEKAYRQLDDLEQQYNMKIGELTRLEAQQMIDDTLQESGIFVSAEQVAAAQSIYHTRKTEEATHYETFVKAIQIRPAPSKNLQKKDDREMEAKLAVVRREHSEQLMENLTQKNWHQHYSVNTQMFIMNALMQDDAFIQSANIVTVSKVVTRWTDTFENYQRLEQSLKNDYLNTVKLLLSDIQELQTKQKQIQHLCNYPCTPSNSFTRQAKNSNVHPEDGTSDIKSTRTVF